MRELASMGLFAMGCIGVVSVAMAYFENQILTIVGYLLMTGLIAGGLWYVSSNIAITFF